VTKNEKISCPAYLFFTEKVNFLLVNKEKKISVKKKLTNKTADFFVFRHFDQITKNKLMRYFKHKNTFCVRFFLLNQSGQQ
jgi:hypothetical protein